MKRIVRFLFSTLLLLGFTCGCSGSRQTERVVVFSCMEESREAAMVEHLEERFPELDIVLQHYSTGDCGAKLLAEGSQTDADIVVGLQCATLETLQEMLADVSDIQTAVYSLKWVNPEHGKYWVWEKYDGGIVVNLDVLAQESLPEPATYQDLLDPAYNGWIVMPTPETSGAGYMFLNNWYNMWGEKETFAYVDRLQRNVSQFVSSGHNVTQLLISGENAIGLVDLMNVYRQIAEGIPLKIIIPDTGSPFNLTGTAVIEGKVGNANVMEVYEYLMGEYVIYDNSHFSPGGIFEDQEVNVAGYPQNIPIANMDTITDQELKESLVAKWHY